MLNTFIVSGRLTKDIELRKTPNGKSVATVTVANDTGWGDNKKTHFFDVVLFEQKAEFAAKYGSKGQMVEVQGELHQRKYTDKNGNNRVVYEIQQVRTFDLMRTEKRAEPPAQSAAPADDFAVIDDSEDLPF